MVEKLSIGELRRFECSLTVEGDNHDKSIPTRHEMKIMSQMYPMPDVEGTEGLFKKLNGGLKQLNNTHPYPISVNVITTRKRGK